MKDKEEKSASVEEESYTQPLLTKHEQLRSLTGKSGEKDSDENDGPRGHDRGHGDDHGRGHGRGTGGGRH